MKKKIILGIVVALFAVFLICGFIRPTKTTYYSISDASFSMPVRLVFLSDIHAQNNPSLFWKVDELQPNIVLFGGDIADDREPKENLEPFIKEIAAKYPCYYVSGNHEYWSRESDEIFEYFENLGIQMLSGTWDTAMSNGQEIVVCGVDDPDVIRFTDKTKGMEEQLEQLAGRPEGFSVLLAHRPEHIESYLKQDFDLILTGHTHGGIVRLPPFIEGLFAPNQGWFPSYVGGRYDFENATMIVGRGLSTLRSSVLRFYNPPEIVVVDIVPME